MNTTPTEYLEQVALVEYLDLLIKQGKIIAYTALPNNVWTKSWAQRIKQKREGLKKGFPDLVIVTKDKILFLELKRVKGGVVGEEQKEWNKILKGKITETAICKGFEEAKKVVDKLKTPTN